jgi:hypothetical protein
MNKLTEINQITSQHNGEILFDDPLQIKSSPHRHLFTAYGVCVGPDGVYVLNGAGEWHGPLLEKQVNSSLMINSIYQRLKSIQMKPSVVVASYDNNVNATIFE